MGCDPLRMLGYSGLSRDMADSDGGSDLSGEAVDRRFNSGLTDIRFRVSGYSLRE